MADVADLPSMKQFAAKEVGSSGWSHFEETRKNSEKKIVVHLRRKKTELDLQIQKAKTPAVPGNRPWPSAREISVDLLAKEWMVLTNPSIEARLYLLDNILPSVIMSLEKLCIEVSKRQLEGSEHVTSRFNPINYLAQHLMRNNPKYSNFAEASPYMKGLQQMVTKLKADVMSLEENKLVKMKVEARRRREDRLKLESIKKEAERGKKERLKQVFKEWLIPNETAPELAQVQLAMRAFSGSVDMVIDTSDQLITEREFTEMLWNYWLKMSSESEQDFSRLIDHFTEFGEERRSTTYQNSFRVILEKLFHQCDVDKGGLLDRFRVLHLLGLFYDKLTEDEMYNVLNPRKWPVAEIVEDEMDEEREEEERLSSIASLLEVAEDTIHQTDGISEGDGFQETYNKEPFADAEKEVSAPEIGEADKGEVPETDKGEVPETDKGEVPETYKGEVPETDKGEVPETDKGEVPETDKGEVPETDKGEVPETDKGEVPETDKGEVPETDKGEVPETDKGEVPETDKGEVPETDKGEVPETDKGEVPETDKGEKKELPISSGDAKPFQSTNRLDNILVKPSERRMSPVPEEALSEVALELPPEEPPPTSVGLLSSQQRDSRAMSISKARRLSGMSSAGTSMTGPGQAWDFEYITSTQFSQLVELFLGNTQTLSLKVRLVDFLRENYKETAEESQQRLHHLQGQAEMRRRYDLINELFDMWDNDKSGSLELDELQLVIRTWKDFSDEQALLHAKAIISVITGDSAGTLLTRSHFHQYMGELCSSLNTAGQFDEFVEYLRSSMKLSFEEKSRKEQRHCWIQKILLKGRTNCLSLNPSLYAAVNVVLGDAHKYSEHTNVSVCIGLLEPRDRECLVFKAASDDCKSSVVGSKLFRYQKQVSFSVVDSGKPIYIPSIQRHNGVHHFSGKHLINSEADGALFVVPIRTPLGHTVGTMSVDTLIDEDKLDGTEELTIVSHEQNFYQGVGLTLGEVFHTIEVRSQLLRTTQVAVEWLMRRCPNFMETAMYLAEPLPSDEVTSRPATSRVSSSSAKSATPLSVPPHLQRSFVLRKVLEKASQSDVKTFSDPPRLYYYDNLFKRYLYDSIENSEAVSADAFGMRHLAYPLRDHSGCAVAVVDLSMKKSVRAGGEEMREAMRVLKLLTMAHHQLSQEGVLNKDNKGGGSKKTSFVGDASVLFHQLMLNDLREKVEKIDARALAELKSYSEPPEIIHQIIKPVLAIFHPQSDLNLWTNCKQYLTSGLVGKIVGFDPFTTGFPALDQIKDYITGLESKAISQSSRPARHLFSWLNVCILLGEHVVTMATRKTSKHKS